jgi:macrolide transport system ATP-binding/permease protein
VQLVADGKTLIMVTHNPDLARQAHRVVEIRNGEIVRDERPRAAVAALPVPTEV